MSCVECLIAASHECSACHSCNYCSVECQKKHWKRAHKRECASLAVRLFEEQTSLAENGNAKAACLVGGMLIRGGAACKKDGARALEWMLKGAEGGNLKAQYNAGILQLPSNPLKLFGITADAAAAEFWLTRAAEGGHVIAQSVLADLLAHGGDLSVDFERSMHFLTLAANAGHVESQYNLAVCYQQRDKQSLVVYWAQKSAMNRFAPAQFLLASCYLGGKGVSQSNNEAVRWLHLAAAQKHAIAAYELSLCYKEGRGVFPDATIARKLMKESAEWGCAAASAWCRRHDEWVNKTI